MPELTNQEAWIDLQSLIQTTTYENKKAVFFFEYHDDETPDETLRYKMRVAIRSVGHKITVVRKYFRSDHKLQMIEFRTTITDKEFDDAMKLYSNWIDEVEDLIYSNDSESESESEDESQDSTDPI